MRRTPRATPATTRRIEQLRDTIVPRATDSLDGHEDRRGGGTVAENYDYENQPSTLPWVIAFVLILTLVMMGWTFRSVTIAILTTVLNLLSVGAAFGVLTLVFQHDWFNGLLDYESSGFVDRLDPAVLLRGPGRPVDGLPRVRPEPGP